MAPDLRDGRGLIIGPMSTPGSEPRPTLMADTRAASLSAKAP
jgi:hypothetical protein